MESQPQKSSYFVVIIVVILILIALVIGVIFYSRQNTTITPPIVTPEVATTPPTPPLALPPPPSPLPPPAPVSTPTPPAPLSVYKDGAYSAIGDYNSPGGSEQINVSVSLKKDIITSAEVTSNITSGPNAVRFQGMFLANFKSQVIGRNIDDVMLQKVSGSSLTPKGWNDAISKIESQAKV